MKTCFGASAAGLSSAAVALLGWRPDEFWNATPAELALALSLPSTEPNPVNRSMIDDLKCRFPDD